jgi:HK97 family phage portal protein
MRLTDSLRRWSAALTPAPAASLAPRALWGGGLIQESYTGAWQKNDPLAWPTLLSSPVVFTCHSKIAQDVSKVRVNLVQQTGPDIWEVTTNSAYSPVLRRPNHYQTPRQFLEAWVHSKLTWGNTYVLKRRDGRGVVDALYVLDARAVTPLVGPDGSTYYEIRRSTTDCWPWPTELDDGAPLIVPARELVHDRWNCFFHPLVGLPPLAAASLAAQQGLTMQQHATQFFSAGNQPNGLLMVAGHASKETLAKLKQDWDARAAGVAVVTGDLKYEQLSISSVDSQFVEQLQFTTEQIAMIYGVPLVILNADKNGQVYGKNEAVIQLYHDECLQPLMKAIEDGLDEALELLPTGGLGVELDVDDLLWMDTPTRTKAAADGVGGGVLSPNEARQKYFSLPPVVGGDSPMVQQQYFSLADRAAAAARALEASPEPAPSGSGAERAA